MKRQSSESQGVIGVIHARGGSKRIPLKNIKTFRYHSKLHGIRQLVCVDDPSVVEESSLMNAKETKAWKVAE